MTLLEIENLSVDFAGFKAVDQVDLCLEQGDVIGIVGESGSGKSVSQLALMGLVDYPGVVKAKTIRFDHYDILNLPNKHRRSIVGNDIAMIFQEPMTSLNPCFTVGFQIKEALKIHQGGSSRKRRHQRAVELLKQVGIPSPEERLRAYPHQMSGGMNQRVMIAMAIACNPKLLIADEPTTALDVTIQAQILDLLLDLQRKNNMALVLITHDMGVVAETVDKVMVMYAGQVMEKRSVDALFSAPRHPYTAALLDALPERSLGCKRLPTIAGVVPGKYDRITGCRFHPRCRYAQDPCRKSVPELIRDGDGSVRCFFPLVKNEKESSYQCG
jgi:dipeptide transport system ATP-binding protein